jgi:uncharacterized protein YutE (UPF0331/DUF86 family)
VTDRELILYKLGELRRQLARARRRRGDPAAPLTSDEDVQDALMLSVLVALQEAVDCAFHIAVDDDLGVPASNSEAFARLASAGVIPKDLATTLADGARLRNRIAHGYTTVDPERFWRELPEGLDALDQFASRLAAHVGDAGAGAPDDRETPDR